MIYNTLNLGRTGLKAMQNNLDNTAHNIANANTAGYKRKNASYQELVNNNTKENEVILSERAEDLPVNAGVKNGVRTVNYGQGAIYETGGRYHVAIEGKGFFGVRNNSNDLILTRNGAFHINEDGSITNDNGYVLEMEEYLPRDQWTRGDVSISSQGEVSSQIDGETRILGQIILYSPEVRGQLIPIDETSFYVGAGNINNSIDNPEAFGSMVQGYLENSNVDMADSMVDLISTQRAYSMNAKSIQTTDEILTMINGLKR